MRLHGLYRAISCLFVVLVVYGGHLLAAKHRVNFVLVGATGNLAEKYLWQSLYHVSKDNSELHYKIYGGARAANTTGKTALKRILSEEIKYDEEKDMENFINSVEYTQLKTCEDYERLCSDIHSTSHNNNNNEDGFCARDGAESCTGEENNNSWSTYEQIFYLSVPPFTYGELAQCISRVCDTKHRKTKIVLEKPYGTDVKSVDKLIATLRSIYDDEQVYLVDHYLGKSVTRNILPFRNDNRKWLEPLLNRDHVERIEVVIKEKETSKGRLNYYDSYGVFLDILQNHAVELLTLTAMDLPSYANLSAATSEHLVQLKVDFLESLTPITARDLIYAQYEDYVSDGRSEFNSTDFSSLTATFGAVLLRSSAHRWSGVPMLLISGKALDTKSSYVRIKLRNNDYFSTEQPRVNEIVFAVSPNYNSEITEPCIAVSSEILALNDVRPDGWVPRGDHFHVKPSDQVDRAYFRVTQDVIHGRRENFVSLRQLKSSWDIWTLAIQHLKTPTELKKYPEGSVKELEFVLTPSGLKFKDQIRSKNVFQRDQVSKLVVCSELEAVETVINILKRVANVKLRHHGGKFHVAFPGGSTPKVLFQALTGELSFPWEHTHVWLTDERCTNIPGESNYCNVYENLLRHLKIPSQNVHPMPVQLSRGLCVAEDGGAEMYAAELETWTEDNRLDVVVLGVGSDGHVASLFPKVGLDDDPAVRVMLTDSPSGVPRRMSLSWSTIKSAQLILVMVMGVDKADVYKEIFEGHLTPEEFPVKQLINLKNVHFQVAVQPPAGLINVR